MGLLRRRRKKNAEGSTGDPGWAPHLRAGRRIYAIGDIHGCAELLERLHEQILADRAEAPPETRCVAVYLGDYIDRGPASRQVIDRLIWAPLPGFESIHLCGNHDDFLLKFLEDVTVGPTWMANGGDATIQSYGLSLDPAFTQDTFRQLREDFFAHLPEAHRDFFRRLRYSYTEGGYFFTHAGVRPGVALEAQDPHDLMWIRDAFLVSGDDFGKVVVHGHTPTMNVENLPNRIGLDTGAVWSGKLSCVVLEGKTRRFLDTEEKNFRHS